MSLAVTKLDEKLLIGPTFDPFTFTQVFANAYLVRMSNTTAVLGWGQPNGGARDFAGVGVSIAGDTITLGSTFTDAFLYPNDLASFPAANQVFFTSSASNSDGWIRGLDFNPSTLGLSLAVSSGGRGIGAPCFFGIVADGPDHVMVYAVDNSGSTGRGAYRLPRDLLTVVSDPFTNDPRNFDGGAYIEDGLVLVRTLRNPLTGTTSDSYIATAYDSTTVTSATSALDIGDGYGDPAGVQLIPKSEYRVMHSGTIGLLHHFESSDDSQVVYRRINRTGTTLTSLGTGSALTAASGRNTGMCFLDDTLGAVARSDGSIVTVAAFDIDSATDTLSGQSSLTTALSTTVQLRTPLVHVGRGRLLVAIVSESGGTYSVNLVLLQVTPFTTATTGWRNVPIIRQPSH